MNNDIKNNPSIQEENTTNNISKYYHDKNGNLWWKDDTDEKPKLLSGSDIKNVASMRSLLKKGVANTLSRNNWKMKIEFKNRSNEIQSVLIPYKLNQSEAFAILEDCGFEIISNNKKNKKLLFDYLKHANPSKLLTQVDKTGWIGDSPKDGYITPSFSVCNSGNKEEFFLGDNLESLGYEQKGSLKEWQDNICQYCVGNDILTFSLCVGLSGALLKFSSVSNSTLFNLAGNSSKGKTISLRVAGSLWGRWHDFVKSWNATDNAIEGMASNHNDTVLILDELYQVNPADLAQIGYMLGNGKGKARCNPDASLKEIKEWRLSILSSGENGTAERIEETGGKVTGGLCVRCVDIESELSKELGSFNNLHEFNKTEGDAEIKAGTFANYLEEQTKKYYGTASEEFISKLKEDNDIDKVKNIYNALSKEMFKHFKLNDKGTDSKIQRICRSFVHVYTAGVLASQEHYKVFTHKKEEIKSAIYKVFQRLLDECEKNTSKEEKIIQSLTDFLLRNNSNFCKYCNDKKKLDDRIIPNRLGFMEEQQHNGYDGTMYYIFPTSFRKEICSNVGEGKKTIRNTLIAHNMLLLDSGGDDKECPSHLGIGRKRMVTIFVKKDDKQQI